LPSLNNGALRLIRLIAVQCVLQWSIPKAGVDLPQPAAVISSQETSQAFTKSAVGVRSGEELWK